MPTFNENVVLDTGSRLGVGTTTPTEPVHVIGPLRVVNDGDGVPLLYLDSERGWVFRQRGTGASTALELTGNRASNNNKNFLIMTDGNVGIGTAAPNVKLHVVGPLRVVNDGDGVPLLHLDSERGWVFRQRGTGASTALELTGNSASNNNKNFLITTTGRVGIGTATPAGTLHVAGSIVVDDDVILPGADCAEDFDVDDADCCVPGTVVVIGRDRRLVACSRQYDTRVAGIVSGAGDRRPGIVLGRPHGGSVAGRRPIALAGTVNCLVDARRHPIEAGDLLTSSDTRGHAMRAVDRRRRTGAIVGKALGEMPDGIGTIPVLVLPH
jgi:hypothetical protein